MFQSFSIIVLIRAVIALSLIILTTYTEDLEALETEVT